MTLVPNAADVDAYLADTPRPDDLPPGSVVLYVGTLHRDRLDVELCAALAMQEYGDLRPVGPVALDAPDQTRLADAGGVLLGGREHTTIPAYLKSADVLVVPHVVTEFTDSLDPIKVYEYLAAARPVVSTPVAGFRDLPPGSVGIAAPAAFVDAVRNCLTRKHFHRQISRWPCWTSATWAGCSTRSGASVASSPKAVGHVVRRHGHRQLPRRARRTTAAPAPASTPAKSAPARVAPATRLRTRRYGVLRPSMREPSRLAQGAEHVTDGATRVATQVGAAEPEHPAQQHDVVALGVVVVAAVETAALGVLAEMWSTAASGANITSQPARVDEVHVDVCCFAGSLFAGPWRSASAGRRMCRGGGRPGHPRRAQAAVGYATRR